MQLLKYIINILKLQQESPLSILKLPKIRLITLNKILLRFISFCVIDFYDINN